MHNHNKPEIFVQRIEVIKVTVAWRSETGLVRTHNEDSLYIDEDKGIFLIADGMGGHENGQLASSLAVKIFAEEMLNHQTDDFSLDNLHNAMTKANDAVYHQQNLLSGKIMGTTFSAVAITKDQLLIGHIGDSRIYRLQETSVEQLTHDHSYLAELIRLGEINEIEAKNSTQKNVLIKALGPEAAIEAQYLQQKISVGDKILLCTDGLYNLISDEEIWQMVKQSESLQKAADQLIETALLRGGFDNITLILYEHEA